MESKTYSNDECGDFQTPPALVESILSRLNKDGWRWGRVLEPTCGTGNFIVGLKTYSNSISEIVGLEIQDKYVKIAKKLELDAISDLVRIENRDIFSIDLKEDIAWKTSSPLLVIGNPPWVTNSRLVGMESGNLPNKSNIRKLSGLDALTGASNFDISEHIILKAISELKDDEPTIAMLCKTGVARNVISFCQAEGIGINEAKIFRINAMKWFGAAVDACLFTLSVSKKSANYDVEVYDSLDSDKPANRISFHNGRIVSNKEQYEKLSSLDGVSSLVWRQGIKHDAASVVELARDERGFYKNKLGELVDIESEYIYPLVKSSDLNQSEIVKFRRWIIVPQKNLHEELSFLRGNAPTLWENLNEHEAFFQRRKSSIYRNKPDFTYFGLGPYTFSDFKVAVSGVYKEPHFCVLKSENGKPIILDDTCYFVSCETEREAMHLAKILNSETVLEFLNSITFRDSMRPLTKKVLQRLDIGAAENVISILS